MSVLKRELEMMMMMTLRRRHRGDDRVAVVVVLDLERGGVRRGPQEDDGHGGGRAWGG